MAEITKDNLAISESSNKFDSFIVLKREAFTNLDQTLTYDTNIKDTTTTITNDQFERILKMYEKSLATIDTAIIFYLKNQKEIDKSSNEARTISSKLNKMRSQTTDRMNDLKIKMSNQQKIHRNDLNQDDFVDLAEDILENDQFMIIDDELIQDDNNTSKSAAIIIENKSAIKIETGRNSQLLKDKIKTKINHQDDFTKAVEICSFTNGVQMFYIGQDGTVSTPSYPVTLSVYTFSEE
jgi:hypothetical protein